MPGKILVVDSSQDYKDALREAYSNSVGFSRFDAAGIYFHGKRDDIGLIVTDLKSTKNGDWDIERWLETVRNSEAHIPIIARTDVSYRLSAWLVVEFNIDALFRKEGEPISRKNLYDCINDLLQNPEKYAKTHLIAYPIPKYQTMPGSYSLSTPIKKMRKKRNRIIRR